MKKKLCVFDFDNTLFQSPVPPKKWKGAWWGSIVSLTPPIVPEKPDSSWWNQEIINQAKEASADSNCYVILLTGRKEKEFKNRVHQLLNQVGLDRFFDFVGFNDGGQTIDAKIRHLDKVLAKDPRINTVEFWDDRVIHVQPFKKWAEDNQLEFIHHLVEGQERQPEGLP